MTGRAEVTRLKQRLDATFQRVADIGSDLELQSDFAKYLCVLVSGYLESVVAELVLEHARRSGSPSLQRFVERNTRRFTNAIVRSPDPRTTAFVFNLSRATARLRECSCERCLDAVDEWLLPGNLIAAIESVDGISRRRRNWAIERVLVHVDASGQWVK